MQLIYDDEYILFGKPSGKVAFTKVFAGPDGQRTFDYLLHDGK